MRELLTSSLWPFAALAAGSLVVLSLFDPALSDLFPPCPFYALTGLYCPGCGTLRAIHELLHANVASAFDLNPLTVLLLPFVGYEMLRYGAQALTGRPFSGVFIPSRWIQLLVAMIVVFGILRNIPAYPFSLLAP